MCYFVIRDQNLVQDFLKLNVDRLKANKNKITMQLKFSVSQASINNIYVHFLLLK